MREYNGWTNYETWCVNLWLSNDEGLYRDVLALAEEHREDVYELAEILSEYVKDLPDADAVLTQASFVSDLFQSALDEVSWHEIAVAWANDVEET